MIRSVKFVSIPVSDQDRALAFYTEKLGFRVMTDQPFDENQRWIELQIPGAETRIALFTADFHRDRIGSPFNGAFASDNVERTYGELRERGVEFLGEPKREAWGTFAIFKDPDGKSVRDLIQVKVMHAPLNHDTGASPCPISSPRLPPGRRRSCTCCSFRRSPESGCQDPA